MGAATPRTVAILPSVTSNVTAPTTWVPACVRQVAVASGRGARRARSAGRRPLPPGRGGCGPGLVEHGLQVVLHGVRRQPQPPADLLGGVAVEDEFGHRALAWGEAVGADEEGRPSERIGGLHRDGDARAEVLVQRPGVQLNGLPAARSGPRGHGPRRLARAGGGPDGGGHRVDGDGQPVAAVPRLQFAEPVVGGGRGEDRLVAGVQHDRSRGGGVGGRPGALLDEQVPQHLSQRFGE